MTRIPYDHTYEPSAPVMPVIVRLPRSNGAVQLAALVDTGAEVTLFPEDVAELELPIAGTIRIRGVTGEVRETVLYRAELELAGVRRFALVAALGGRCVAGRDLLRHVLLELDGPARRLLVR